MLRSLADASNSCMRLLPQAPTTQAVSGNAKNSHVQKGTVGTECYCSAVQHAQSNGTYKSLPNRMPVCSMACIKQHGDGGGVSVLPRQIPKQTQHAVPVHYVKGQVQTCNEGRRVLHVTILLT